MNEAGVPAIPVGAADWGDLRRMDPVSDRWGFDRGLPVDRYYIENFLARHAGAIRGRCIEVMNSAYLRRFGQEQVEVADVVDINADNPKANIVGDLCDPALLAPGSYDCFVLTQTLPVVYDGRALIANCYAALKPGGTLLVTAPCLCRYSPHPEDYWRLTDRSLERLIREHTDSTDFEILAHGNLVVAIAFLMGMATAELSAEEMDHNDPRFPIVVTAVVRKP
jgi:hypothetical protein